MASVFRQRTFSSEKLGGNASSDAPRDTHELSQVQKQTCKSGITIKIEHSVLVAGTLGFSRQRQEERGTSRNKEN